MEMSDSNNRQQQVINQQQNKPGLRGKINAMCVSCIYDPFSGGGSWRKQVEDCTSYQCPLFDVRPLPRVSVEASNKPIQRPRTGDRTNG